MRAATPERPFPAHARAALANAQLRRNVGGAVRTMRARRDATVGELVDWEQLRLAAEAIKRRSLRHLPSYLEQLEASVIRAGGQVHWATDAAEANRIVTEIVVAIGARSVVKVKSMATEEIGLNDALGENGIQAIETDLAEVIVQLAGDCPSHILAAAVHLSRRQVREIFLRAMPGVDPCLTDDPRELAMAARSYLRREFLRAQVAVSGANFACAESGSVVVVESEGNGRMCLTLPRTLITVMGIEKVIPTARDLEVFLQILAPSAAGERMNPYTSVWTGVTPGDGPEEFHLVLLDNGRSRVLADPATRSVLACIRCGACLNICPIYERTGGQAYGSVYPGPIGAVLTPAMLDPAELVRRTGTASLPFASSLCGACYEVCPVRIDIPRVLVHLRARVHGQQRSSPRPELGQPTPRGSTRMIRTVRGRGVLRWRPENAVMQAAAWVLRDSRHLARAQRLSSLLGRVLLPLLEEVPGPIHRWHVSRAIPSVPRQSFRGWWHARTGRGANNKEPHP